MKYATLRVFLSGQSAPRIKMSFDQVAAAAKVKLPASAYRYPQWWQNDAEHHVQAKAWIEAGYKTENVDIEAKCVEFVRLAAARGRGVREMQEAFEPREPVAIHPMIGAMKGTFTISPDWDVTKPVFDEDDMAEWEASLERKAKLIEEGLRGKRS